jgi:hypothetical protein
MSEFIPSLKREVRRAYCEEVTRLPTWFSNLRDGLSIPLIRKTYDVLRASQCNAPVDDEDFPSPPFTGGQCETTYTASWEFRQFNSSIQAYVWAGPATSSQFTGPASIRETPATTPCTVPTEINQTFELINGSGGVVNAIVTGCFDVKPAYRNLTFTRVDGQPDDCGDPDTDLPPPGNIETTINFDYGDDNEFNLTVPLIFAPIYVALDGTLNIPITIPEINLTGNINLDNDFDITLEFAPNIDPGQPDDPALPSPDGGADGEDPETGPNERIIGVMVRVTDLGDERVTVIPQSVGPAVVAPRAATVKFLGRFGGASGWTPDIGVKSVRAYIPCPIPSGAVDVQVTPDFGTSIAFTPIRGRPLTDP